MKKRGCNPAQKLNQWRTATATGWINADKAIVLSDMRQCLPASALSAKLRRGHWKVIPYEAGGIVGNLILASEETGAPPVKLPLKATGWHAIFVGILGRGTRGLAWLKLDGDPAPQPRVPGLPLARGGGIEEIFFKVAQLDKTALEISQQSTGVSSDCGIAYVKLIPLTAVEVKELEKDRQQPAHRKLTATLDNGSFIGSRRPTTREELLNELEVYRHTDFDTLLLQFGGADQSNYPSPLGPLSGEGLDDFPNKGSRYFVEALRELARKHINPTRVLIEGAHDLGMKVHMGIRPGLWSFDEPYPDCMESPFFTQHPEWHCVDRDGTPLVRMSWAVPEVRHHLVDKFREGIRLGADGINLLFNRGVPMVFYEEPFLNIFRQQYGKDPRRLKESDPRIMQLWAKVVTTFFREARTMLDEEQTRRTDKRKLEITAIVFGNEHDNMLYGLDLRTLVAEGLMDGIIPTASTFGTCNNKGGYDFKYLRAACGSKGIPFRPLKHWGYCKETNYKEWIKESLSFYKEGAEGVAVWDANAAADGVRIWSIMSRLGHADELRLRLRRRMPERRVLNFHRLGKYIMDSRFLPSWGG